MRTYTIGLSIVVHIVAACAAVIVPLTATDELPAPRTATEFIQVMPAPQPPPPPAPARLEPTDVVQPARADAAPLDVPDGIQPEPPTVPGMDTPPADGGIISFGSCDSCAIADAAPPPTLSTPPVRIGGTIKPPQKITDVAPVYPPIARASHIEGIVILEAMIGEDGSVRDVRVLRSVPLLDSAAIDAVRQWRFTATLLNGEPVRVLMTVTVAFRLR